MFRETDPLRSDDTPPEPQQSAEWEGAYAQPAPFTPTTVRLSWSQDMTLRSYSAVRTLGGIAMEHFEDKPWLIPVYLAPSPIPGVKSWLIYAYMGAATARSEDPDLIRLRGALFAALTTPANIDELNKRIPSAVAHNEENGKADISYKSIFRAAMADIGKANQKLFSTCVKEYPALFVGLPMHVETSLASLDYLDEPIRFDDMYDYEDAAMKQAVTKHMARGFLLPPLPDQ